VFDFLASNLPAVGGATFAFLIVLVAAVAANRKSVRESNRSLYSNSIPATNSLPSGSSLAGGRGKRTNQEFDLQGSARSVQRNGHPERVETRELYAPRKIAPVDLTNPPFSGTAGEAPAEATEIARNGNPDKNVGSWPAFQILETAAPDRLDPLPAANIGSSNISTFPALTTAEDASGTAPVADSKEPFSSAAFLGFYGLYQQPFDVTPDPAFLYFSRVHREALTTLAQGIENLRGFMTVIAKPGMGKTTLLQKLMEDLKDSARIIFLFQTQCTSRELLGYILHELEVDHTSMDIVAMHYALNQALLEEMLRGRRFILIVDEAQNLHDSVLETIRLLSDYETTHSKLIQIILAGQSQLLDALSKPSLLQLRQRIAMTATLEPFSPREVDKYVEHRLRVAGSSGEPIFTREALKLIAERSSGIPRCINNMCFNAMLAGFSMRQKIIGFEIMERVAGKLEWGKPSSSA
jgi:general secretion pathway protein A